MPVPESKRQVLEDDGNLKPDVAEGEDVEFASLDEEPAKPAAAAPAKPVAATKPVAAATTDDEIPESFRGKSVKDVIRMYQDAQSVIGRQGQELGKWRHKVDEFIQANLAAQAKAKQPDTAVTEKKEFNEAEFFAKPQQAIADAIANHPIIKQIGETLGKSEQDRAVARAEAATGRFNQAHPDAGEIIASAEFRQWVGSSPIRQALFRQAHERFDFDAGNELFSTWKALNKVASKQTEVDDAAAASEAARALAKRRQSLKDAAVPSGGDVPSAGKKIYRRADILKLMEDNPERYAQLADEIEAAYREKRVK